MSRNLHLSFRACCAALLMYPLVGLAPAQDADVNTRARAAIERALRTYQTAVTYQDGFEMNFRIVARDKAGADVGQNEKLSSSTRFAYPNRLAIVADDSSVHADGQKLWQYNKTLNEYTESDAPDSIDIADLMASSGYNGPPHPAIHVLVNRNAGLDELFPMLNGYTKVQNEEFAGRAGVRVHGTFDGRKTIMQLESDAVPFNIWLDEKTGLMGELQVDLTNDLRQSLGITDKPKSADELAQIPPGMPTAVDEAKLTLRFNDAVVGRDIPATEFVYKPVADVKKVDEFTAMEPPGMPDPSKMVGEPAPTFSGNDFDGKPIALEQLRGKVVVLDFWATWCGPCLMAMPSIQNLHEKYGQKPVVILGINTDRAGMEKKIRATLKSKKVTFRQFLDTDSSLGMQYRVTGIPCTFVIDQKGVIRNVHQGYSPMLEKELVREIDKLLAGDKEEG